MDPTPNKAPRADRPAARRRAYVEDAQAHVHTLRAKNARVLHERAGEIKNPDLREYCLWLEHYLLEIEGLLRAANGAGGLEDL